MDLVVVGTPEISLSELPIRASLLRLQLAWSAELYKSTHQQDKALEQLRELMIGAAPVPRPAASQTQSQRTATDEQR